MCERLAQDKYYEEQAELHAITSASKNNIGLSNSSSSGEWTDILRSSDNLSVRSAPPIFHYHDLQYHHHHKRTHSALAAASSPTGIVTPLPRPRSLYVPFRGCLDTPPPPPGRAAKDILNALTFTPSQSSRYSSQGSISSRSSGASWASSSPAGSTSPNSNTNKYLVGLLPSIPQSPPCRKLRSTAKAKSSSLAVLENNSSDTHATNGKCQSQSHRFILPLSYSTQELVLTGMSSPLKPSSPALSRRKSMSPKEPIYSPTNPLNNSENLAILVLHPPIIEPPPEVGQENLERERQECRVSGGKAQGKSIR